MLTWMSMRPKPTKALRHRIRRGTLGATLSLKYKQALRKLKRTFPEMRQQLDPVLEGRQQLRPCPCCGEGWLPRWPWTPQHGLGFCECKLAHCEWDSWRDEWETAAGGCDVRALS